MTPRLNRLVVGAGCPLHRCAPWLMRCTASFSSDKLPRGPATGPSMQAPLPRVSGGVLGHASPHLQARGTAGGMQRLACSPTYPKSGLPMLPASGQPPPPNLGGSRKGKSVPTRMSVLILRHRYTLDLPGVKLSRHLNVGCTLAEGGVLRNPPVRWSGPLWPARNPEPTSDWHFVEKSSVQEHTVWQCCGCKHKRRVEGQHDHT